MGSAGKRPFERKKAKNAKHTATVKAMPKPTETLAPEGKAAAPSSACAHPRRPLRTGRRERAGENDESPKRSLDICVVE